jgi:hypothetical protein
MNLSELLTRNRSAIVNKWCDLVLETYPKQSQRFLKKKDQFGNPVGRTISEGITSIFDELIGEADSDKLSTFLDSVVRIRAIQEFSPSQAVGFVFGLKKVIREQLSKEMQGGGLSKEWAAFQQRIDGLALMSFDIYTECRQRVFDIRVKELRNQSHKLLKMAGLAYELPEGEDEGDLKQGNNGSNE